MTDQFPTSPQTPTMHPIEKLWRELDLPEWFLGNGGSNTKLYALYDAIRAALSAQTGEPDFDGWPIEALDEIGRMRAAIERGEYTELPPLGDSRRRAKTPQPDTAPSPLSTGEQQALVKALEEIEDLGANGETAARLGNIAHAALIVVRAKSTLLQTESKTGQPIETDTAPSPLSTGEVRQIAGWQPSKYTDGPNESGYFTAGIDIHMEKYGKPDTHSHAIEFHAKDQTTAEARRDLVIAALSQPPATEQIRREVIEECAKVADTEAAKLIATGNALLASAVATTAQFSEAELHDQAGTAIQKIAADLRALAATEQARS